MKLVLLFLVAVTATTYFSEDFNAGWEDRWVQSTDKGDEAGNLVSADGGVKTETDARFYQYSAKFDEFSNKDKTLVFQFSVKHGQNIDCGGGYFKLLPKSSTADLSTFNGDTPYHIMFGPDICGATKRTHAIITYKDRNELITRDVSTKSDTLTHVYTLVVNPDQTFKILIDNEVEREGNLVDEWSFLPPKTIDDPSQSKPADWVDDPKMDDPEDVKPEGYDDIPKEIPDEESSKPTDWDDDLDGIWTAPLIDNPDYKGPWTPNRIDNPDYKGPWEHPQVPNPEYHDDDSIYAFDSIAGVGLEIWQVKAGTVFDKILVTDSEEEAKAAAEKSLEIQAEEKAEQERQAEEDRKKAEEEAKKREAEEAAKEEAEAAAEEEEEEEDSTKEDL